MKIKFIIFILLLTFIIPFKLHAQERQEATIKAQVTEILQSEGDIKKVKIKLENNNEVEASVTDPQNRYNFEIGDRVLVRQLDDTYYITDFYRTNYLYMLFGIFAVLSIFIAGIKGISSLIGLITSFFIIFKFILPNINSGYEPVTITIIGAIFIVCVTFYLSHGFSKKTTVSVIGTIISLIITGILALIFINKANITGAASEELAFLQTIRPGEFNAAGLLLSGIIIGTLGVLDDITISQAAVAAEIKKANSHIEPIELFTQTMNVGKDHIASLVNTLILVYTGGFLPLLLLISNNPQPFNETINYEMFAEEIIRTLISSIGLVLAVPITTGLATLVATKWEDYWKNAKNTHNHTH